MKFVSGYMTNDGSFFQERDDAAMYELTSKINAVDPILVSALRALPLSTLKLVSDLVSHLERHHYSDIAEDDDADNPKI